MSDCNHFYVCLLLFVQTLSTNDIFHSFEIFPPFAKQSKHSQNVMQAQLHPHTQSNTSNTSAWYVVHLFIAHGAYCTGFLTFNDMYINYNADHLVFVTMHNIVRNSTFLGASMASLRHGLSRKTRRLSNLGVYVLSISLIKYSVLSS